MQDNGTENDAKEVCTICLEDIIDDAAMPDSCNDQFHEECLKEWLNVCEDSRAKCPSCEVRFSKVVLTPDTIKEAAWASVSPCKEIEVSEIPNPSASVDFLYVWDQYGNILTGDESDHGGADAEGVSSEVVDLTEESSATLKENLKNLSEEKLKPLEEESYLRLKVRRNALWADVKMKLERRKNIFENAFVKVQFVGEAGVDDGGPKRELFTLLHKDLYNSSFFCGEGGKAFAHNLAALADKHYYWYGVCCSLAIINGAVGPQFFRTPVVDYILSNSLEGITCSINDVPVRAMKSKLTEVSEITDLKQFQEKVSSYFSEAVSYFGQDITLQNRSQLVGNLALYYTVIQSLGEISQFLEGFSKFGVLGILRKYPVEARNVLEVSRNTLTAEILDGLFYVEMSDANSSRNVKEKAILFNWNQLLEDIEHGFDAVSSIAVENNQLNVNITLESVLAFVTGSSHIPPIGFSPQPSISFCHDDSNRKLHVSTCSNTLYFPVSEVLLDCSKFKEEFISCMLNSPGFGNV